MYKSLLLNLLLICLFISCAQNDIEPDRSLGVIPLSIDNAWYYESSIYDSTCMLVQTVTEYSEVIGSVMINNKKWFIIENNFFPGITSQDTCINNTDGYYIYQQGETQIIYKYPALINEEYVIHLLFGDSLIELTHVLTSLDTTIITPAGMFHCMKYYIPRVLLSPISEILESDIYIDLSVPHCLDSNWLSLRCISSFNYL